MVAASDAARKVTQRSFDHRRAVVAQRINIVEEQAIGRERAGFIGAEHIDIAERFNRIGLLYQRALPPHLGRAQRIGHHDHQEKTIWHLPGEYSGDLH